MWAGRRLGLKRNGVTDLPGLHAPQFHNGDAFQPAPAPGQTKVIQFNDATTTPDNLSATNVLHDRATITWDPSTDPEGAPITYEVQYRKHDALLAKLPLGSKLGVSSAGRPD